jgi:hypothetical protein
MPIKTFRGLMADETVDIISLHTSDGTIGYQIKKFNIIPNKPGADQTESTFKVYSVPQTTATHEIDFSDNTLLAAAYVQQYGGTTAAGYHIIVFDNMVVNQDMYITHIDTNGAIPCNYYLELEQMKLDLSENTVATLKDVRNITDGL